MTGNQKYHGLVNRKRVIRTLEDKANITGYRWVCPQNIPDSLVEKRNKKTGKILYYSLTERISFLDVDGSEKVTIKTSYYEQDKQTPYAKSRKQLSVYGLTAWLAHITVGIFAKLAAGTPYTFRNH